MKSAMSKTSSNSHSKIIATSNQTTENENKFSLAHFTRNILAILGLNHTFANWTSQTLEDIRTLVHSLTHSVSHVYLLTFCQWFLVVFFFFFGFKWLHCGFVFSWRFNVIFFFGLVHFSFLQLVLPVFIFINVWHSMSLSNSCRRRPLFFRCLRLVGLFFCYKIFRFVAQRPLFPIVFHTF